jgi:tetratricopeptide (TPR) repeat protein
LFELYDGVKTETNPKKLERFIAKKAILDYNSALALDSTNAKYYTNRADSYNNLGEYKKASKDCIKAIQLNPNSPQAYINRGVAKWNLKLNFCSDFKKACTISDKKEFCHNYEKYCK